MFVVIEDQKKYYPSLLRGPQRIMTSTQQFLIRTDPFWHVPEDLLTNSKFLMGLMAGSRSVKYNKRR